MLLPIVGAIVNSQFCSGGESLKSPKIGLVGVFVPSDFYICPVDHAIIDTPPPAVLIRGPRSSEDPNQGYPFVRPPWVAGKAERLGYERALVPLP